MKLSQAEIDELYSDALPLIEKTIAALESYPMNNSTIEGRVKGELKYLRQRIMKKDLAVPQAYHNEMRTIAYAITNATVGADQSIDADLGRIYAILFVGRPLLKEKHIPWLLAQLDTLAKISSKDKAVPTEFAEAALPLFAKLKEEVLQGRFHLKQNKAVVSAFNRLRRLRPIKPNLDFDIPFSDLGWVIDNDVGPLYGGEDVD